MGLFAEKVKLRLYGAARFFCAAFFVNVDLSTHGR